MNKLEEAIEILRSLGLPTRQQNERSALTLIALAELKQKDSWRKTKQPRLRIWDIMAWMREHFGKDYAANSRETIRRQTIHQFEQARIVDRNPDDPKRPTNSGDTVYQLTDAAKDVLKSFGTKSFTDKCDQFIMRHGSLATAYRKERRLNRVPIRLANGDKITLSPGLHNELQKAIVEKFAPRFASEGVILYLGDTAKKQVILDVVGMRKIKIPQPSHDKLPDVVIYVETKNWLFLVEAVTSHGPVSPKRYAELETALKNCTADRIYVTAFSDFKTFKKYASDIVWESEVWIAEAPDHMIHFNGDKFLGPYSKSSR
jgi:hypothetical protein